MFQQEILVNWAPQETRVAVVEYGSVQEIHLERHLERGLVGNVYLGRVARVLPGMQSAFIDIGLEKAAFLHVADVWSKPIDSDATPPVPLPIEKQVFEGQTLLVQVVKDPMGTKGARLTTQISLAGRLLVFLPQDDHIGISQKIPVDLRNSLRERLQAIAGKQPGGFILRTNGEDASDVELADDMAYLRKTWARIKEASVRLPPKSIVYQELTLMQRVLRDVVNEKTQVVRIDSREQFDALRAFGRDFMPAAAEKLELYRGERPIFDLFTIEDEIDKALGRRVELKSGGYLVVDQTEALTTVDVNTGAFIGARNFDDTIFKTNLEAAHSIARQLRLRNLGGIIVVDFIDMTRDDHQTEVLLELKKQLARDRVKTSISGFSALGLVELTRKRTQDSLAHQLTHACPVCAGRGHVKTPRSLVYDILREVLREARQFNPRSFRIMAVPDVIDLMLDEESQHLAGLSDFIGKPIALQSEASFAPDQYEIVLM
jgi:ribonuclease G